MNMNFIKRKWFDLLTIFFVVLFLLLMDGPIIIDPAKFDELADIGWCMVPFALCWLMLGVASTLRVHAECACVDAESKAANLDAHTATQQYRNSLGVI